MRFYFLVFFQLPTCLRSSMKSIKLWMENKQRNVSSESWAHCNLREVELYNFQGNRREVELVEYLVNHTVALEKIQLDRKGLSYYSDGTWNSWKPTYMIERKRVFRMLHERIPATTKLTIL